MTYEKFRRLYGCMKQDVARGVHINEGDGWRPATGWEMAALQNGRAAWLAGLEEPMAGAYVRNSLQLLYQEGFHAEIHDAITACSAYRQQDARRRRCGRP